MRWRRRLLSRQRKAARVVREKPTRKVDWENSYETRLKSMTKMAEKIDREIRSERALKTLRPAEEEILRKRFGVPDGKTLEEHVLREPIDIEAALSPKRPKPGGSGRIKKGG